MNVFLAFMITWFSISLFTLPVWLVPTEREKKELNAKQRKIQRENAITIWGAATILIIIVTLACGAWNIKLH
jgi:heme/copper-type cytochrome/quinol oxidase subunit 2